MTGDAEGRTWFDSTSGPGTGTLGDDMPERRRRLLLVDDEIHLKQHLRDALEAAVPGMEVLTANNGAEAIELLEQGGFHMVLTDLNMPEVDGFELLAYLTRNMPEMPVIVMTAFGNTEVEEMIANLGTVHYIEKPIDFERLLAILKEIQGQGASGRVSGITLPSFLQLVEAERKTCTILVQKGDRQGRLFFRAGKILDAELNGKDGLDAALEILSWDRAELMFTGICTRRETHIDESLQFLCLEAMRLMDERESGRFEALQTDENTTQDNGYEQTDHLEPGIPTGDENVRELPTEKERVMHRLQEIQEFLKKELDGFVASAIVDAEQGMPLAGLTADPSMDLSVPSAYYTDTFRSAIKSFDSVGWGQPTEVLMPGKTHTIVLFSIKDGAYYQGIAVMNKGQMGMVRAIFSKVRGEIESLL